ncbi:MAG: phage major capsid protein [Paludibacteraceae bacterium]|nr:phage major capsid protein [Paludibacteraceae bacterium]
MEELKQIEERMAAISTEAETADEERMSALESELTALEERKSALIEERKKDEANVLEQKETIEEIEEREIKPMGIEEIRNSKEYINAYANYLKTGKDDEVRMLLTTNATVSGAYLPVPEIVESRIRTAWGKLGIMDLVNKTFVKGNLKVGFELTADGALVHNEGTNANSEEALTFGVVELKPESIKKWITISDEAMDMGGEEFLYYIYDEITYRIAKKAQEILLAKIVAASTTADSDEVSVAEVDDKAPSVGIVAECLGKLSDEAANPVIVMNKATWSQFKAAQYAASYAVDPFEGLPVYFDNTIPTYSSTATTGVWLIVGDFGRGAQANFPNGQEIGLKFDDLSLAEKDLVKIVGREYVGIGLVGDKCFCRVTMHT